jgi:hypothetical protein
LDERDAAVFREFFPDPLDVALLVKPFATRPAIGGFFLKEKGALVTANTPLEFKFETPLKSSAPSAPPGTPEPAEEPVRPPPAATAAPSLPKPSSPAPRVQDRAPDRDLFTAQLQPSSPWPGRLIWAAFCVALLAFGAACGYEYAGRELLRQRSPGGVTERGGLPNANLYAIQLQTLKTGSSVMVKWDRDAAPIQAALHGVLTVTEGANSKEVKLGFAELRNGTAMYPLTAPQIRFRLEVFFKDNRSFVESIVYREGAR